MRLVGQTFGRYTILEHLAAGSELYVCEMGGLQGFARRVVAKLISEGSLGLIEQARTTATLNHPNLAQLIDVVRVPGGYFVVSEFIPGRSVREVQQRTASLGRVVPLAAVASIGAQAARVLGWLHLRQRPHGAVTPRNLMLGEDGAVKLTDLGISAALTRQEGSFEVSRYRPPEWTSGGSAAGDIFALGVVLWELLRNAPFNGQLDGPAELFAPLREVLTRAVASDPTARPVAGELENALMRSMMHAAASVEEASIAQLLGRTFPAGVEREEATNVSVAPTTASVAGFRVGRRQARLGGCELLRGDEKRGCAPALLKVQLDPANPKTRAGLLNEARTLARIRHWAVFSVWDLIDAADGRRILVGGPSMDFETLASLLAREGCLSPLQAVELTRDLLGALATIHGSGVTGPSLEPESVVVAAGARPFQPLLVEFGQAKDSAAPEDQLADLAKVGQLLSVVLGSQPGPKAVGDLQTWLVNAGELTYPHYGSLHQGCREAFNKRRPNSGQTRSWRPRPVKQRRRRSP